MGEPANSSLDWLAKKFWDEVSLQYRAVWDLYLKFYTVFLTFNILGLGVAVQHIPTDRRLVIVVAFVLQNALSMVTALFVAHFSNSTARRIEEISAFIARDGDPQSEELRLPPQLSESPLPGRLGFWSGCGCAFSHLTLVGCWIATLYM
jgi:hypothetical protein